MVAPRRPIAAIGATKESARAQIDALGPYSEDTTPSLGDSLIWNGDAWAPGSGGGGKTSPRPVKYVVGNSTAGDTLSDCDFLDPGDGSGIESALFLPKGSGNIVLRPGFYDLGAGNVGLLTIPPNVDVFGASNNTVIRAKIDGSSQGVFSLSNGSSLRQLQVIAPQPTVPAGGVTALISISGDDCELSGLLVSINPNTGDALTDAVQVQPSLRARIINNYIRSFNANGAGGIVDIAGAQVMLTGNTIESPNGQYCVSTNSSDGYLAGNILNAHGGTQILNTGLNNTIAPNVLL